MLVVALPLKHLLLGLILYQYRSLVKGAKLEAEQPLFE